MKGDTCSFVHSAGNESHSPDAAGLDPAHILVHCKYWNQGTCKRGDACLFIHSEVGIPPADDDLLESPIFIPTLTSHPTTTNSDELRKTKTAEPEISVAHGSSDSIEQKVDSQAPSADVVLNSSVNYISLPLEFDSTVPFHTFSTNSDETCTTENTQVDAETLHLFQSPVSSSAISHEASLEECAGDARSDSSPSISSKEYEEGEKSAAVAGPLFQTADTSPDGELRGLQHLMTEGVSLQDGTYDREQQFAQDGANAYGTNQSYEESLTTKRVDSSTSFHQLPSYFEAEQATPEFMQSNMDAQAIHPYLTSPEAADPLADPTNSFCKFFAQSRCNRGDACSFRHSITINEYARDPQLPLWSSEAQLHHAEHVIPSTVSAFGIREFHPLRGKCRNGDGCPYLHAPPPSNFTPTDSQPNGGWPDYNESPIPPHRNLEVRSCRYYENGYCRQGDRCQFGHEVDVKNIRDDQQNGRSTWHNNDYVAPPCKYFNEGNCKKGDKCNFLHDKANTEEERADGWGETASNGWGETDDWGDPTTNSWTEGDNDERTSMTVGDAPLSEQSPASPTEAKLREMRDKHPTHDATSGSAARKAPNSGLCRFYIRGRCEWGSCCNYRHDRDLNTPHEDLRGATSQDVLPEECHGGVEKNDLAKDSWGETIESPCHVPLQAVEHDQVDIGAPPGESWGDAIETPWDDAVQAHHPSRTDDINFQNNGVGKIDENEVIEAQPSDDDDEKTWSTPWSENVAESTTPIRIHAPCKAFGQGYCFNGDVCRYQHIAPPDPVLEAQRLTPAEGTAADMPENLEVDANSVTEILVPEAHLSVDRSLFHCTMCFGSGCSPVNVLTPCDASRVLLYNISLTATHDDLRDIADLFGSVTDIVIDVGETSATAAIEFRHPTEALDAVTHLDGQTYDSMVITAGLDTLAKERITRPLISSTVKVSWASPTLSAWAIYSTITTAKAQTRRLDGSTFNGRKIKAEFHRPRPKQTHSFAVKITGLPSKTSKESLEQLCEENTLVSLETSTYDSTPVNTIIRDLLANLGTLDSFDVPSWNDSQAKVVGFAKFRMGVTALERMKALNGAPQSFLGGGSLSMRQVFHTKHNLSARQFNAVHEEIDRLGDVHKPHVSVQFYENLDEDKVVLHVYGDSKNPEKFGRLNIELQVMLQGEILMSEGKGVWDEYFDISSSAKMLEKLNADSPFFIQVDNRTQTIHLMGNESSRQAARTIVSRLLKKVRALRCVISLDRFSLHGLLTGGYQALQKNVGLNKVTLDVVAPELIVRGDSDIVRQVRQALDTHAPSSPNDSYGPDLVSEGMSCPVCYQAPADSIKLSCRHAYCGACLQHVLQTSNSPRFTPPRCIAAAAGKEDGKGQQCTESIPYTVVRDLLRVDEEEQLLKASFLYYVRNHPDEYFFCPTVNCEMVYGHGRDGVVYRCPSCSTQICSSCRLQYHEGLTCSERREIGNVIAT